MESSIFVRLQRDYNGYETAEDEEGTSGRVLHYNNVELYIILMICLIFILYV